jgi:dTDP-4-amino-4,6-dideoxygalactose transaminase
MTDIQASIGIHQLRRITKNRERRSAIWSSYMEALHGAPVVLPLAPDSESRHAYHLFTLLIDEGRAGVSRDTFLEEMHARGIGVGVHYVSLAEQPVYRERFGWRAGEWPVAKRVGRQTVSLPLGPGLMEGDVERVVRAVRDTLRV